MAVQGRSRIVLAGVCLALALVLCGARLFAIQAGEPAARPVAVHAPARAGHVVTHPNFVARAFFKLRRIVRRALVPGPRRFV
ncbi:MAG: hypothetical protein JSS66_03580 [Armatimonadetes bacterium]|nr:hypothetical protein [Armatimonadota bacterium]